MTHGKTVVLGRICYETWPRAHADGRRPVVITSRSAEELHPYPAPPGAEQARLAHSVREALRISRDLPGEILICGGARIFEETLPLASKLYLTSVDAEVSGDVLFPEWRQFPWRETWRREGRDQNFSYTMSVLEKDPEPSR
jgi:dihydrofolate reductase